MFNHLIPDEIPETVEHYGFSINSPVYPGVVPRFKTLIELTGNMSQVVTDFTGIPTNITAVYNQATDYSSGSFMFGIEMQKTYEYEVSFSSSVSLGDFTTLTVEDSSLVIDGSFTIANEFGVILGSEESDNLKILGEVNETNCTDLDQNVDFDIILYKENNPPIAHNISIIGCEEGVAARIETVKSSVNAVVGEEEVTVSLVGSSSLVLAFNPYWSKVELFVPKRNIYGLKNETTKKTKWHFANGATTLGLGLHVAGEAAVSANVRDAIEVVAVIDASIGGDLEFNSGISGQLVPMNIWFSNLKSMFDPSDEFYDPDFATCRFSLDGAFDAKVEITKPFDIGIPLLHAEGYFASPFILDILDRSAVQSDRPDVILEIDFPLIGKIKNLSFGEIVKLLQKALIFLVGDRNSGDSVESCSGGLLGKEIFGLNVSV